MSYDDGTPEYRAKFKANFDNWVKTRPQIIQDAALVLPPDIYYRIKSTGQKVSIVSYFEADKLEDVEVTVFCVQDGFKGLPAAFRHEGRPVRIGPMPMSDLERWE